MTRVYYNEHDRFAAAWLRELIRDRLIPAGDVDERDVQLVQPADLAGYEQCHFFAGIGGWPYALGLAGWGDRPVWTGSCPCQPFSAAGKGAGFDDPRHLWPTWFRLIRECRPPVVFGEQVASADGRAWLDTVSTDLEAADYAFGAADLAAASVGAPHIRQRVFFMAHGPGSRRRGDGPIGRERGAAILALPETRGAAIGVDDSDGARWTLGASHTQAARQGGPGVVEAGAAHRLGQPDSEGPSKLARGRDEHPRPPAPSWVDPVWLPCRDGKARPTQPGLFPLAHGIPNRVGILRGAGNAIVPPLAAEFIRAADEAMSRP